MTNGGRNLAGRHHQVSGGGVAQATALAAALGALAGLELVEHRVAAPPVVFLAARTALFALVAALDGERRAQAALYAREHGLLAD
ncbi:hypothetical protein [Dactylosporangium sp. NPDC000521]|uniref:hypothetical protein n=1 Tax=Dactylosporangium sp. NPDC000521 TaxID=3363975 RepID=UPI0036B1C6EB